MGPNAEDPCLQLFFDQSIKMPVANDCAKRDGAGPLDLCGLENGREGRENCHDLEGNRSDLELQKENYLKCRWETMCRESPRWSKGNKDKI